MHLVNLGWETFHHVVRQVDRRIVFEVAFFGKLREQVAIFAVSIEQGLLGRFVDIVVKHLATIQAVSVIQDVVVQDFVTSKVQGAHVVTAAFYHIDMNNDGAGSLDIVVLVQSGEQVFHLVTDNQLFFIGVALLDSQE